MWTDGLTNGWGNLWRDTQVYQRTDTQTLGGHRVEVMNGLVNWIKAVFSL